jgi:hypothetical protein
MGSLGDTGGKALGATARGAYQPEIVLGGKHDMVFMQGGKSDIALKAHGFFLSL